MTDLEKTIQVLENFGIENARNVALTLFEVLTPSPSAIDSARAEDDALIDEISVVLRAISIDRKKHGPIATKALHLLHLIAAIRARGTPAPAAPSLMSADRCTCRPGRDHDGSEFGPCEYCEAQAADNERVTAVLDEEQVERAAQAACAAVHGISGWNDQDSHWKRRWRSIGRAVLEASTPAPAETDKGLSKGAADVLAERRRQIEVEGWTPEHDDQHVQGDLARAAACYAIGSRIVRREVAGGTVWPWMKKWWKPSTARRDLIKAGALIIAEIERLDRLPASPSNPSEGA